MPASACAWRMKPRMRNTAKPFWKWRGRGHNSPNARTSRSPGHESLEALSSALSPRTINEKVFQDELPLAPLERAPASAAGDFTVVRRDCLDSDDLIKRVAIRTVKMQSCVF